MQCIPISVLPRDYSELVRRGILTHYELGQSLGLDRFETDALLKCHEVTEHSLTHEDVDADVKSLNELRTLSS
jgi:hypothetical protein